VIARVADQISGGRPGARRDSYEQYVQRLEELEAVAKRYEGVERVYAIQAGRELRIFVQSDIVSDLQVQKLAKSIAQDIEQELNYPGEIKVTMIRETRVIEYAR
ncbi:MAG: ribonuclease Y, partial [Patescibacteria group bacterium]